eukprot:5089020-Amphidinium_carterae.1
MAAWDTVLPRGNKAQRQLAKAFLQELFGADASAPKGDGKGLMQGYGKGYSKDGYGKGLYGKDGSVGKEGMKGSPAKGDSKGLGKGDPSSKGKGDGAAAAASGSNPFTKAQLRRWQRKVARANQTGQPAPFGAAPLPSNPFQATSAGGPAAAAAAPPQTKEALEAKRKDLQDVLGKQDAASYAHQLLKGELARLDAQLSAMTTKPKPLGKLLDETQRAESDAIGKRDRLQK